MTQNYELVYYVAQKCVKYRDTGVSNKHTLPLQSAKILLLTSNAKYFLVPFENGNFSNIAIAIFDFSLLLHI